MRVLIVDDHPLLRAGVRSILGSLPGCEVIGEAGTAREALAIVDAERPDSVVMDIALPGMDGVIATREIKRRAPDTLILIFSVHHQISDVLDAFAAGASGYLLKSNGEALPEALTTIAQGERYVASEVALHLASPPGARGALDTLSEREREVFRLATECLTTREIARELCISRKTVDTHLYRIHRKLGVRNSAELVRLATRLGLHHGGRTRALSAG
jgi:DNA-binding NarL/FixJ family response regulator